jgi:hypothetical protein
MPETGAFEVIASSRTAFRPLPGRCTSAVRLGPGRRIIVAVLAAFWLAWPLSLSAAEDGAQQRREARGWLQLERDQSTYRERREPLSPSASRDLEQIERRQDLGLRQLQQDQQRAVREAERRERFTPPGSPPPLPATTRAPREETRQRLDLRIEHEILSPRGP